LQSLAGVAIAVALVPPLAVAGIGIGRMEWVFFAQAFLLFLTNLIGIILAGSFTFRVLGYSAAVRNKFSLWLVMLAMVAISFPLYFSFRSIVETTALENSWKHRDNYNLLVDWKYRASGNLIIVTVSSEESDHRLRTFLIERALATMQAHIEEIHGEKAKPLKVLLDYEAPDAIDKYKDFFRCPLRFSQERSQLYYPLEWMDFPLQTYDPKAGELLGALRTSIHDKLCSCDDIVRDVKIALRRTPGRFPSLEQVASDLAMSSRTLHRKLGQRDMRFQDLLDAERRRVAEDLLISTKMNVQQVAEKCGFAESQNFSQAFRRWTGMTPSQFRASRK
jgi:AraC-like DNA-binding protein